MKLLRTIAFDASDRHVFDLAAAQGELAVSGVFAFVDLPVERIVGKTRQAFANGFLGLASGGRSTFTTVCSAGPGDRDMAVDQLAELLVAQFGAPSRVAAEEAAAGEIADAAELADGLAINSVLSVHRRRDADGAVRETFRTLADPTGSPRHARIWTVEPDEP